jgi:predicted dehydrogenase
MTKPVGIGLIGIGGYGRSHLDSIAACHELGLCNLEAVTVRPQDADPESEDALKADGVRVYRDFDDMLNDESSLVELIAIPTGISSHRFLSVDALEHGYHVVCEKPAAGTIEDVRAMKTARDRAERILAIGYQYLYSEAVQMVKAACVEGKWGRLLSAKGMGLWPRSTAYYGRNEWAGKIESGGVRIYDSPVQNAVSHYLQLMLYLAGDARDTAGRAVRLYGENYRAKPIKSADTQFLRIDTDTEVRVEFWCSHSVVENHDIHIVLEFERETVEFVSTGATNGFYLGDRDGDGDSDSRERFGPVEAPAAIRARVFSNAIEAIRRGGLPISSIDNAANHTEVVETLFTRCSPVVTIDDAYIDTLGLEGGEGPAGENRVIRGMDELAVNCFARRESFAETGIGWAREGTTVELS